LHTWNILNFLPEKHGAALTDSFNDLLLADPDELGNCFENKSGQMSISDRLFRLADDYRYAPSVTENPLRNPKDTTKSDFILLINMFFHLIENIGDTALQHQISALRGSVLKMLKVGEFDRRSKFVDPSRSLVVPSVLCKYCLSVRNVDLLRDEEVLEGIWVCAFCKQPYDTRVMQRWVFEELVRRVEMYQVQDLRCGKCGRVQGSKLCGVCDDGGEMGNSVVRQELIDFMELVIVAGKFHRFEGLEEAVRELMERC
jgi:hypothetical protein